MNSHGTILVWYQSYVASGYVVFGLGVHHTRCQQQQKQLHSVVDVEEPTVNRSSSTATNAKLHWRRRRSELSSRLTPIDGFVWGIGHHNNRIYVVCREQDVVRVFSSTPPYTRLDDISVDGGLNADDIISSSCLLVIVDGENSRLLKLAACGRRFETWVNLDVDPVSASLSRRHVILSPFLVNRLILYRLHNDNNNNGQQQQIMVRLYVALK